MTDQRPLKKLKLLIVDDEVAIAQSIKAILCPESRPRAAAIQSSRSVSSESTVSEPTKKDLFEVHLAHTAEQALVLLKNAFSEGAPFSGAFFDVLLGEGMDGIRLAKESLAVDPDLNFVFVTAYQDRSVDAISEVLGEQFLSQWDYVNKPFSEGEIIQKARNMTERRFLVESQRWHEQRLQESQSRLLESEKSAAVAAIGRGVAHEFGNLVMQIMGHSEMALLKKDEKRMKEALEVILKASETAQSILLKFKKMSSPQKSIEKPQLVLINKPLEEALELMQHQFKKSQVTVHKDKVQSVLLEAYPHSLVQVFMNLFINATHAMPQGGQLFIELKKSETSPDLYLEIRDTGGGLPEPLLEKVFEPNFTTKGDRGSGLGLSICKDIIENEHLGELKVSNTKSGPAGFCVQITLPLKLSEKALGRSGSPSSTTKVAA
jgi:signal transduction histidine kinase